MLEEIINKKKLSINKEAKREELKIDFIKKIYDENYKIMEEYIKEKGLSLEEGYEGLQEIIFHLATNLHMEHNKEFQSFQIKDINETLYVKLGYFEILDKENINPERYVQQCTLTPTKKGREVYSEYRNL